MIFYTWLYLYYLIKILINDKLLLINLYLLFTCLGFDLQPHQLQDINVSV